MSSFLCSNLIFLWNQELTHRCSCRSTGHEVAVVHQTCRNFFESSGKMNLSAVSQAINPATINVLRSIPSEKWQKHLRKRDMIDSLIDTEGGRIRISNVGVQVRTYSSDTSGDITKVNIYDFSWPIIISILVGLGILVICDGLLNQFKITTTLLIYITKLVKKFL